MDAQAMDDEVLQKRALAAYFRLGVGEGEESEQSVTSVVDHYVTEHHGKRYVVLENFDGVLAVYRVRNDGMLKALRRWPPEIQESRMDYAVIVTANVSAVTQGQVTQLSRVLTHAYRGDASFNGSRLTARLRIPREAPVFTVDQAKFAAQRYLALSAELVGIEPSEIAAVSAH